MPLQFEARKVALKQDRTGFVLTLAIHPDEIADELLRDFVGARYMCVMVRLNDDESPLQYDNRVQRAGMLCRQYYFQKFMFDAHGSTAIDETSCTDALHSACEINSRTELNGSNHAKALFDALVKEFEAWNLKEEF
jgi:hypothetical protein